MSERRKSHRAGLLAENAAAFMLMCKGYRIIARRWKNPACEIDLLVQRRDVLAIVEVKRRATREEALISLLARQRTQLLQAARFALARWPEFGNHTVRFDAMLVGRFGWPQHLPNAWQDERQTAA